MRFEHRFETTVNRSAAAAWIAATTLDGIVDELPRLLRLRTTPAVRTLEELLDADATVVATLCLGPLPVLGWTPGLERLDAEARMFVETSTDMTWMRAWRHERRIVELGDGRARVEDRVSGSSALPLAGAVVGLLFRARHRRLARA
ncbi:MAG: hypothetical protein JWL76_1304 [Thermoleophilia bacterium]|nr:hypothetical protein [Thermoleophilia bacterium]